MIPSEHHWLFWDADPTKIDLIAHRDYVLERTMARGDWAAMQWLIKSFERATRAEFLRRRGHRLTPRERAFWCLVSGLPNDTGSGGGRPLWAG
ncbi:MAG: hypothetical protein H0T89_00580 [Deltaproteobacteria bacterium]|nr:hypothetical protein [Deltaproteobacteria bacterium]MDQ3297937.1 hypothetical protein [Myxococcota bacterium]